MATLPIEREDHCTHPCCCNFLLGPRRLTSAPHPESIDGLTRLAGMFSHTLKRYMGCKQECEEHDGAVILLATLWGEGKQENGDVCWFVVMMIEVCLERCFYASVLSEL